MKEYSYDGNQFENKVLSCGLMSEDKYLEAHKYLVIPCHDIFIKYQEGILLVNRNNLPAKNVLWPIGGRIKKGINTDDSLKEKVLMECNLKISNLELIGYARTYFITDPFNHGNGTDTINFVYFGVGEGNIKLDEYHNNPFIIKKDNYDKRFEDSLHPYVKEFLQKSFLKMG